MAGTRKLKTGEYLFREGDPPTHLYIIKSGTLSIRKMRAGIPIVEIAQLGSDEVVGELSFFDCEPRSASVLAITDVELLELSFEEFGAVYNSVLPYVKTVVESVAERLRKANETICHLRNDANAGQDGTLEIAGGSARP